MLSITAREDTCVIVRMVTNCAALLLHRINGVLPEQVVRGLGSEGSHRL